MLSRRTLCTLIRERAYELLDRSLTAKPDDAEAAWAFGPIAVQIMASRPDLAPSAGK
jgi:hypothetical protein